mmetsp:Transcript_4050/g.8679  ORF Transcript_4050/g.8679 Transcript_4050/m.8679 type:complete len:276 (+) Transcript_4050:1065-1892(+)
MALSQTISRMRFMCIRAMHEQISEAFFAIFMWLPSRSNSVLLSESCSIISVFGPKFSNLSNRTPTSDMSSMSESMKMHRSTLSSSVCMKVLAMPHGPEWCAQMSTLGKAALAIASIRSASACTSSNSSHAIAVFSRSCDATSIVDCETSTCTRTLRAEVALIERRSISSSKTDEGRPIATAQMSTVGSTCRCDNERERTAAFVLTCIGTAYCGASCTFCTLVKGSGDKLMRSSRGTPGERSRTRASVPFGKNHVAGAVRWTPLSVSNCPSARRSS